MTEARKQAKIIYAQCEEFTNEEDYPTALNDCDVYNWPEAILDWANSPYAFGYCGQGQSIYNAVYVAVTRMKDKDLIEEEVFVTKRFNRVIIKRDDSRERERNHTLLLKELLESFEESGDESWTLDSIEDLPFTERDKNTLVYYRSRVYYYYRISIYYDKKERTITLRRKEQ